MRSNSLRETPEPSSNPTHFSSPGSASTIAETTATISIVDMDQWCVAANDNSVQCFLKTTLQSMIRDSARELHIEQEAEFCRVRVRTNGRLTEQKVNNPSLATELLQTMRLANSGAPYSASANDDFGELNFPIQLDGEKCDLRVCHYTTVSGKCITLSVNAASAIPEVLEQTRLDAKSINEIRRHYNSMATSDITLICSPSNDLLSSVFYALLGEVNSVERKIVSFQHRMDKTIPRVSQVLANTDLNRSAGTDNLLSLVSTARNIVLARRGAKRTGESFFYNRQAQL